MDIILVRHTETVGNQTNIIYGQTHSPLSERGIAAMAITAEYLKDEDFSAVYSSPQERARVLADEIMKYHDGPEIINEDRVKELHCGILEQMTYEEAAEKYPEEYKHYREEYGVYRVPGGENYDDLLVRAGEFIDEILSKEGYNERPVLVVSHGMVTRAMLSKLTGFSIDQLWRMDVKPGAVVKLHCEKAGEAVLYSLWDPELTGKI